MCTTGIFSARARQQAGAFVQGRLHAFELHHAAAVGVLGVDDDERRLGQAGRGSGQTGKLTKGDGCGAHGGLLVGSRNDGGSVQAADGLRKCTFLLYTAADLHGFRHMNWDDLRFLVTLGREGTLAATARRLAVDQTTVARRLRALALPTLEIDLSGLAGEAWTWNTLSVQVLETPGNRRWLPDELPLGELPCAEVPKAEAVPAGPEPAKEFDRWQIPVGPGYARVTRFSSGDHSIWHPSHATTVRKIVQKICTGRGYWNRQYQNWVVFRPFIQQVFEELARSVQPQSIGLEQSYAKSRL